MYSVAEPPRVFKGKTFRPSFVERIYPVPRITDSHEDWLRFYHLDLPYEDRRAMRREIQRAELRLSMEDDPHPWVQERVDVLRSHLAKMQPEPPPLPDRSPRSAVPPRTARPSARYSMREEGRRG